MKKPACIYSKLAMTPERLTEQISPIVLAFLLVTLKKQMPAW